MLRGKKLIVHRMHIGAGDAGEIARLTVLGEEMTVGCGASSSIVFDEVQMEGKKRMGAAEFMRGFQLRTGERLGV
jgi:methionyl-tRNA formyltransferase